MRSGPFQCQPPSQPDDHEAHGAETLAGQRQMPREVEQAAEQKHLDHGARRGNQHRKGDERGEQPSGRPDRFQHRCPRVRWRFGAHDGQRFRQWFVLRALAQTRCGQGGRPHTPGRAQRPRRCCAQTSTSVGISFRIRGANAEKFGGLGAAFQRAGIRQHTRQPQRRVQMRPIGPQFHSVAPALNPVRQPGGERIRLRPLLPRCAALSVRERRGNRGTAGGGSRRARLRDPSPAPEGREHKPDNDEVGGSAGEPGYSNGRQTIGFPEQHDVGRHHDLPEASSPSWLVTSSMVSMEVPSTSV